MVEQQRARNGIQLHRNREKQPLAGNLAARELRLETFKPNAFVRTPTIDHNNSRGGFSVSRMCHREIKIRIRSPRANSADL